MKKLLYNIREFFWPLIDKSPHSNNEEKVNAIEILVADENIQTAFELGKKIFDTEEERRKGIESKAALLLGTISVASSIIVTSSAIINGTQETTTGIRISVIASAIVAIYAASTVWFSVRALERGTYQTIGFDDINIAGTKNDYYKHLIAELIRKTRLNYPVLNRKINFLVLAQEYYKRAIIMIFGYAFVVVGLSIFPVKPQQKPPTENIIKANISFSPCDTFKTITLPLPNTK